MSTLSADDVTFVPIPNWDEPTTLPNIKTTHTKFDPKATKNVKVDFRQKNADNRWKVTEKERGYAIKCKYPKDLEAFDEDVSFFLRWRN